MFSKYQPNIRAHQTKVYYPDLPIPIDSTNNLFSAVLSGNLSTIQEAMATSQINANVKDENKNNLLHIIIGSTYPVISEDQKLQIIKFLVNNGVSIDAFNIMMQTPLHMAAKYNYPKIIKYLTYHGANVNSQDIYKKTPLHYVVNNSLVNCTAFHHDEAKETLFNYENINRENFKEINNILAQTFQHQKFRRYFTDIANTIQAYIHDDNMVKKMLENSLSDIIINMHKYYKDTAKFGNTLNTVITNTVNGLKRNIINNAGIDKDVSKSVIFSLDINKVDEHKKGMNEEYNKRYTQITNKISKTIKTVMKTTRDFKDNYYNLIDGTIGLRNNLKELMEIGIMIINVFNYEANLDFSRISNDDVTEARNYILGLMTKITPILENPAAQNRSISLNLINDFKTLPDDNYKKPLYHVKFLIEYADTVSNILNDIQTRQINTLPHLVMLKLVLPSIEQIFNNILIIIKIQQYIPLILEYIVDIDRIPTILKGIKEKGAKIINVLRNMDTTPGTPANYILAIDILVTDIERKINAYKIPQREIQNIKKITKEYFNKSLEESYIINVKYYNDLIELMECLNMNTSNNHLFGYVNTFGDQVIANNVFNKLLIPATKLPNTLSDFIKENQEYMVTEQTLIYSIINKYMIYLDDTMPTTERLSLNDLTLYVEMRAGTDSMNQYILDNAKHDEKGIEYSVNNIIDNRPQNGKGYLLSSLNHQLCNNIGFMMLQPGCVRNIRIDVNPLTINKGNGFKLINNYNLRDYITLISYHIAEQFKDINTLQSSDNDTHSFKNLFDATDPLDPDVDELLKKMGQERIELDNKFRLLHYNDVIISNAVYNVFANSAIKLVYMYFEAILNISLATATVDYLRTMQIPDITRPVGFGINDELLNTLKLMVNKDKVFDLKKFDNELMDQLANPGITYNKIDLIKYESPKFVNKQTTNDDNKLLSYIYEQNYNSNITHSTCINENSLSTVKQLIAVGANPYIKDNSEMIPLCYAISTLNLPIVNALTISDSDKRYKNYTCSRKYVYKQYLFHDAKLITLNSLKSTLIFHNQINDNMINRLVSKEAYKGLIPEYIENILPQVIIMFNHYLYDQMLTYSKLNKNKINQLLSLISEFKMNDIEIVNSELVYAVQIHTLEDKYRNMLIVSAFNIDNVQNIYKEDFKTYLKAKYVDINYITKLTSYNRRILNYKSEHDKVNSDNLKQQLNNYINGLKNDKTKNDIIHDNKLRENPIANKQIEKNTIEALYQEYFDNIRLKTINLKVMQGIPTIYDELFDRIDNNSKIYKQFWDNYIKTPSVYTNLHLILVKIMMYFVGTIDNNNLKQINGARITQNIPERHFELIKEIYDNVIMNSILPHLYSSTIYGSSNILLNVTIDIIRHVVKTNIMPSLANLLYAELIVHTKQEHNENLIQRLYRIFVNDKLSLNVTKYVLKIYEKDEEKENSFDFMFSDLNNYINTIEFSGEPLDANNINKLYNVINETIKPYYTDLLITTIESMKLLLDNYYIFIINDYKYLQIFKATI